eukprot:gene944-1826_t
MLSNLIVDNKIHQNVIEENIFILSREGCWKGLFQQHSQSVYCNGISGYAIALLTSATSLRYRKLIFSIVSLAVHLLVPFFFRMTAPMEVKQRKLISPEMLWLFNPITILAYCISPVSSIFHLLLLLTGIEDKNHHNDNYDIGQQNHMNSQLYNQYTYSPNLSLFWYLDAQMFNDYHNYFRILISSQPFLYALPIFIRFKDHPLIAVNLTHPVF